VRRFALILCSAGSLLAAPSGCDDPPNQFRVVALEEAKLVLRGGQHAVVEAVADPAADETSDPALAMHWELPLGTHTELSALPEGPLLIVAPSRRVGHRSAATAARARGGDVLLFIAESAEQRRTLYAPLAAKGAAS
jgi:hypothetical protein